MKFRCNTSVPISIFVHVVNSRDARFGTQILVWCCLPLDVVIVCGAGQLGDVKRQFQSKILPQFLNHLRFLYWCRSSSKTKACKFFK